MAGLGSVWIDSGARTSRSSEPGNFTAVPCVSGGSPESQPEDRRVPPEKVSVVAPRCARLDLAVPGLQLDELDPLDHADVSGRSPVGGKPYLRIRRTGGQSNTTQRIVTIPARRSRTTAEMIRRRRTAWFCGGGRSLSGGRRVQPALDLAGGSSSTLPCLTPQALAGQRLGSVRIASLDQEAGRLERSQNPGSANCQSGRSPFFPAVDPDLTRLMRLRDSPWRVSRTAAAIPSRPDAGRYCRWRVLKRTPRRPSCGIRALSSVTCGPHTSRSGGSASRSPGVALNRHSPCTPALQSGGP